MTTTYAKLGDLTIIPSADLTSATSEANTRSPARVGDVGFGKRPGIIAIRDAGSGDYRLVFAHGSAPTDKWEVVDGSAEYTPS